jgi:hypothetical protein
VKEGEYGANTVYTYMSVNGKVTPVETFSGIGQGNKGEWWCIYNIFDIL